VFGKLLQQAAISGLKKAQKAFGDRSPPWPVEGAYIAPLEPPSGFKGPLGGREGLEREAMGGTVSGSATG